MVLAVNWQPAFCESRPQKPECRSQVPSRFDAENFSLHGLWPQPPGRYYCGVSEIIERLDRTGNWKRLPNPDLSPALESELKIKMPGYQSALHRHEWYKHGTCVPGITAAETYFTQSLGLLDAINRSGLRMLFDEYRGRKLTRERIAAVWETDVTLPGVVSINILCDMDNERHLIRELRFEIVDPLKLTAEIGSQSGIPTSVRGCRSGWVDEAGLQ